MVLKRKRDSISSNTSKGVRKIKKEVDEPKVHPPGTSLANLPYDIVTDILLKLPLDSVLICKHVCKSWHSIISDPHFAQLHFERASITALVRTSSSRRVSRNLHLLDFDEFKSNKNQNFPSDNDCGNVCSCMDYPRSNCDSHIKLELKFKLPLRDSKMVIDTMLEVRRRGKKWTNISCKPRDDKFDVVNSCNGLLCLCIPGKSNPVKSYPFFVTGPMTLVVCNPITGEFIRLPQSENDQLSTYRNIYSGLGYLKNTNEYKVITISVYSAGENIGLVEIHTLGTRLWRNVEYHGLFWWNSHLPLV